MMLLRVFGLCGFILFLGGWGRVICQDKGVVFLLSRLIYLLALGFLGGNAFLYCVFLAVGYLIVEVVVSEWVHVWCVVHKGDVICGT